MIGYIILWQLNRKTRNLSCLTKLVHVSCDRSILCRGNFILQFFGITCGLSAPYVAGQINYTMHQVRLYEIKDFGFQSIFNESQSLLCSLI